MFYNNVDNTWLSILAIGIRSIHCKVGPNWTFCKGGPKTFTPFLLHQVLIVQFVRVVQSCEG